jgi:hypothetical protein
LLKKICNIITIISDGIAGDGEELIKQRGSESEAKAKPEPLNDWLAAEAILEKLNKEMAEEFQQHGGNWPRDWMQKHVADREALLNARNVILNRIETGS